MTDGQTRDPAFEALLDYIQRCRNFDFTGYKRLSLMRRVTKRMHLVNIEGYGPYMDYLEVHPDEFKLLFDTILINVTSFFRDSQAWEILAEEIVPRIIASKRSEEPIRVWSAGCASGEEAYSLAIVLAEALGSEAFRDRVKIYATDVDDAALTKARQAVFDARELHGVLPDLQARYFEPTGSGQFGFQKDLRRCVIFGRHDLIQDAPISRIDLLACRNTLMYFNSETQARILERFHYALSDRGFLFLGKAETLMTYTNMFVPVDLKRRIFAKVPRRNHIRDRQTGSIPPDGVEMASQLVSHVRLREVAFETGSAAQLVIDFGGLLALANEKARSMFNIEPADIGRPFQDLQISYRPVDLRSCVDRAYTERKIILLTEVEWFPRSGEVAFLDVHVVPLFDPAGTPLGASITFFDATVNRRLQEELQASHKSLEVANEELQSTNEELETMNEELQSTIEELETTNEELQSTNEELETTNEELQATNEEIETVNDELGVRGEERDRAGAFLRLILGSLTSGVIVVDRELLVQLWNTRSEELWGLRADEVQGKNLLDLEIGLPLDQLKPALRACLDGEPVSSPFVVDATSRRGKPLRCRVTCTAMTEGTKPIGGVIVLVDGEDGSSLAST